MTRILALLLALTPASLLAGEARITFGLYTEHYISDRPDYNEDNRLVQVDIVGERYFATLASFENSHYVQSYLIGMGAVCECGTDGEMGFGVAAVYGYQDELKTHVGDIIFAPVAHFKYDLSESWFLKINILPAVYNAGGGATFARWGSGSK